MRASLGRVLDNPIRLGDLAQRIAAMALLAAARLACARAQAPQHPRLLQPVARGRLGAVGAVQAKATTKLSDLGESRIELASQRIDQLDRFRREIHPTLESEIDVLVSNKTQNSKRSCADVTFRTHPGLAVTVGWKWRHKALKSLDLRLEMARADPILDDRTHGLRRSPAAPDHVGRASSSSIMRPITESPMVQNPGSLASRPKGARSSA
jgi:hypothetical protein